jgi:acetyl esterase
VSLTRRAGSRLIEAFFEGVSGLGRMHPRARRAMRDVEVIKNVRYGHGPEGLLDVYRPKGLAPNALSPAVLYVHGGGFRMLSKETHWVMGLQFAKRGYTVFSIDYRLAPQHRFPAAMVDAAEAYAWVVANAKRYGGDARKLILAGESAGANIVTSLAVCSTFEREEAFARKVFETGVVPFAVLPACGILQVTDTARFRREDPSMLAIVAERIEEVGEGYLDPTSTHATELADPLLVYESSAPSVRDIPPFFIPCGTYDPLLVDTVRLAKALRARGVDAEDAHYKGVHAFHAFVFRPEARRCWNDTHAFLAQRLKAQLDQDRASLREERGTT